MILAYEFEYVSKNLVLESFLKVISEDFGVNNTICRDLNVTTLYIDEDEQKQHAFADYLSSNLPISIFLKSSNAKVVNSIKGKELDLINTAISLPFTKKSIELAKDSNSFYFFSPYVPNEIGITGLNKDITLTLESSAGIKVANNQEAYHDIYTTVASAIKNGEKVKIKTPNGFFTFFKIDNENLKYAEDFEIIPTDLSIVQKMVNLRENELIALASLEKPIIRAKVNMIYGAKNILPTDRVQIRKANTLLLEFICEELYKIGIEFIAKSSDTFSYSYFLDYDADLPKIPDIEISVLENGEIFILNNDEYASNEAKQGLEKFDKGYTKQFASVMKERNLFEDKTGFFYFSKKHNDKIAYHDLKKGILSLVEFPTFSSIEDIFDAISNQDESGKKLVENYKKTFSNILRLMKRISIPKRVPSNLCSVFAFTSLIVGFSNDYENAAEKLIENAEDFGGTKGVRIDYRLQDEEKLHVDFNPYRLIRSAMSFKLAGTDDLTLSFGIIESFSYFVSDYADSLKETLGCDKIALGGSIFGYPKITELVAKNLLPNHKIYFNQELPIENL